MANAPSTIKHVTYSSQRQGPRLLVLGAVHGNETCGPVAIARMLAEFDRGGVGLARGQVTFVPVCNPEAYRRAVRFTERNLNRFLVPTDEPATYEARLGNMLCPLLEQCDAVLDLHSYPEGSEPFVIFSDEVPGTRAFAAGLGPGMLMNGWNEAYAASGHDTARDADESIGTIEYATRCGAIAALVECGQHDDREAPEIAYQAIRNALRHLRMVEASPVAKSLPPQLVTVRQVVYRDRDGAFTRPWNNFAPVRAGEAIAAYEDGEVLTAPGDGFVVIPWPECPVGQEWYYWGSGEPVDAAMPAREEAEIHV